MVSYITNSFSTCQTNSCYSYLLHVSVFEKIGSCPKVNKIRVHKDSNSSETESNESGRPTSLSVNVRSSEYKKHDILGKLFIST